MNTRLLPLLLILAAFLSGCASTSIKSTWRDDSDTAGTPRKLVVFVAVKEDNLRKMAENRATQALDRSLDTTAGYTLDLSPELDSVAVREALVKGGFDAALVARLVSVDKSQMVVPAQTIMMPDARLWALGPRYHSFYTFYPYAYTAPPYTVENTRVIVETLLYRLPEGKPVWTAISESANPESSLQIVDELISLITKKLREEGLLPPR